MKVLDENGEDVMMYAKRFGKVENFNFLRKWDEGHQHEASEVPSISKPSDLEQMIVNWNWPRRTADFYS